MNIDELSVNQDVEIEVKKGPYRGKYESRISDIYDEKIDLLMPYSDGDLIPLRVGSKIIVFFAGDTAAYKFQTEIIERSREPVPVLTADRPEEDGVIKIQRRQHFRLELRERVHYRKVDREWENIEEEFRESHTLDISGGGIKLLISSEEELQEGDLLEIKLEIQEIEDVNIISRVVNEYDLKDLPDDSEAVGLKFLDIGSSNRDTLMGWLFEQQRQLMRKGLL